jgi:uncharacterized protein
MPYRAMSTISLLMLSNVFMTFAWYGHLKYGHDWPLWKAILVSWSIALIEYCLAVPANRLGFLRFSGFQLKIMQEVITISVFIVFAIFFLKRSLPGIIWWHSPSSGSPHSSPLRSRHPDRSFEQVREAKLAVGIPDQFSSSADTQEYYLRISS